MKPIIPSNRQGGEFESHIVANHPIFKSQAIAVIANNLIAIITNPAQDRTELSFRASEQGNAEIIIMDILGNQLLKMEDYSAYNGSNSFRYLPVFT